MPTSTPTPFERSLLRQLERTLKIELGVLPPDEDIRPALESILAAVQARQALPGPER